MKMSGKKCVWCVFGCQKSVKCETECGHSHGASQVCVCVCERTYPLCRCCSSRHGNHVSANHVHCTLTFHYRPSIVWTQLVTWLLNHNLHRCTYDDVFEYIRWCMYSNRSTVSIDRLIQCSNDIRKTKRVENEKKERKNENEQNYMRMSTSMWRIQIQ